MGRSLVSLSEDIGARLRASYVRDARDAPVHHALDAAQAAAARAPLAAILALVHARILVQGSTAANGSKRVGRLLKRAGDITCMITLIDMNKPHSLGKEYVHTLFRTAPYAASLRRDMTKTRDEASGDAARAARDAVTPLCERASRALAALLLGEVRRREERVIHN